jgi:hypothetical protein
MVSVLTSSAVDRGFESRSSQTKDYTIGICCFSAKQLEDALQGIRKDLESMLPSTDDSAQFVSWAGLEDALQGIRQDLESKFPSPDDFAQDKENLKPLQ